MAIRSFKCYALGALLFLGGGVSNAAVIYSVGVDTSSISGQSGMLDFQYNAGVVGAQSGLATVSEFSTDGTLSLFSSEGAVSGDLGTSVEIQNSNAIANSFLQDIVYGSFMSFQVTFSGPNIDSPLFNGIASDFAFFLLDDDDFFPFPLLTDSFFGDVLTISVLDDGLTNVATYDADGFGTPSVVSASEVVASSVPLSSTVSFLMAGLLGLRLRNRRLD